MAVKVDNHCAFGSDAYLGDPDRMSPPFASTRQVSHELRLEKSLITCSSRDGMFVVKGLQRALEMAK
ncbi:hypothetical protein [Streptomyces sp. 8N616]|uniref:hypothetical protein n=1 Tax=Streptomyces sp. 8N616 TaxID=3457414 RepID=UPI003FD3C613